MEFQRHHRGDAPQPVGHVQTHRLCPRHRLLRQNTSPPRPQLGPYCHDGKIPDSVDGAGLGHRGRGPFHGRDAGGGSSPTRRPPRAPARAAICGHGTAARLSCPSLFVTVRARAANWVGTVVHIHIYTYTRIHIYTFTLIHVHTYTHIHIIT